MLSIHLHIKGFLAQSCPFTIRAGCSATIPAKQYAVLNLLKILFYFFKEIIDAMHMLIPFPQKIILFGSKVSNGFMNREIEFLCSFDKLFTPQSQFLTFPWCNGPII